MLTTCILSIFLGIWIYFLCTPAIIGGQEFKYRVNQGASIKSVSADLAKQQVIKHPFLFNVLIFLRRDTRNLKAGEYLFQKGATPSRILDQMVQGTGMVYHPFTIVPGWTFHQVRDAILKNDEMHHTIQTLSDAEVMTRLGYPDLKPEGEFFPDTYYFVEGVPDLAVLKMALHAMQYKLNQAWQQRAADLPFQTPYEVLIAASIIEKEAYYNSEKPIIAGVMVNRLRKNMLLQFDPTVIYGMGDRYDGAIHHSDLLADTPYNTYMHKGLTPTPISMPSLASIQAAVQPMQHDYLYFVARSDKTHQFSKTLVEHNQAVKSVSMSSLWFFNDKLVQYQLLKVMSQHNRSQYAALF